VSVGVSAHTPAKQERLDRILRGWMSVAKGLTARYHRRARVIDLTAGPGWVKDAGDWGSPVRILHAAHRVGLRDLDVVAIDSDPDACAALTADFGERRLPVGVNKRVIHAHCEDALLHLAADRQYAIQLVYFDGNGGHAIPVEALEATPRQYCDLLIHASANGAYKRRQRADGRRWDSDVLRLPRKHGSVWVDRNPAENVASWQWALALLTNWEALLGKFGNAREFTRLDSPDGVALSRELGFTVAERRGDQRLDV
jgi:three-Cys-motif partner protein